MKILVACAMLGLSGGVASASVVRFTFTGTVDQVSSPIPVQVQVGEPFSISYTFETTTPDIEPSPGFGVYLGALIDVEGQIGSMPIIFTMGGIEIRDNSALGDVYSALTGAATSELSFYLADWQSVAFTDDSLPQTLDLALFEWHSIEYRKFLSATSETLIGGVITGFSSQLVCYPDCNKDGQLTIADFSCFQGAFVAGDPYADCNNSGALTTADFACFQQAFATGCP